MSQLMSGPSGEDLSIEQTRKSESVKGGFSIKMIFLLLNQFFYTFKILGPDITIIEDVNVVDECLNNCNLRRTNIF